MIPNSGLTREPTGRSLRTDTQFYVRKQTNNYTGNVIHHHKKFGFPGKPDARNLCTRCIMRVQSILLWIEIIL